jgi:hypothetical protein
MLVNRDPFARQELHRHQTPVNTSGVTCEWCGNVKRTRAGKHYLYRYEVQTDGGRKLDISGLFCSVGCMRSYYS